MTVNATDDNASYRVYKEQQRHNSTIFNLESAASQLLQDTSHRLP
jgi:hypothetical protein